MNSKRNELYILLSYPYSPEVDGSSIIFRNIFKRLNERASLLYLHTLKTEKKFNKIDVIDFYSNSKHTERKRSSISKLIQLYRLYKFIRVNSQNMKEYKSIITNSFYIAIILYHFKKKGFINSYSLLLHDCLTKYHCSLIKEENNKILKVKIYIKMKFTEYFEKKLYPNSKLSVVVSEDDAQYLYKMINYKPYVIELGVDNNIIFRNETINRKKNMMLFLGNFAYKPNLLTIERLVDEILPLIDKKNYEYELCLVGSNLGKNIKHKNLTYLGFVEDINELYNQAAVFICPMTSGSGMKTKIIESMAAKTPVICTIESLKGINHEHILDDYIAESNEQFVDKIIDVFINPQKYSLIAENAFKLITDKFLWDNQAKKYINLITS